jgi:hypothetical protein
LKTYKATWALQWQPQGKIRWCDTQIGPPNHALTFEKFHALKYCIQISKRRKRGTKECFKKHKIKATNLKLGGDTSSK